MTVNDVMGRSPTGAKAPLHRTSTATHRPVPVEQELVALLVLAGPDQLHLHLGDLPPAATGLALGRSGHGDCGVAIGPEPFDLGAQRSDVGDVILVVGRFHGRRRYQRPVAGSGERTTTRTTR